jgi:hypothetical protein
MTGAVKSSFKTSLKISLEIHYIDSHIFWQKLLFILQIGDHFYLNLNSEDSYTDEREMQYQFWMEVLQVA